MKINNPIALKDILRNPPIDFKYFNTIRAGHLFVSIGKQNQLRVIVSDDPWCGFITRHVSMSHESTLPTYEEMKRVKEAFIGKRAQAYQIFPPEKQHVNIHENCLHLWAIIGEDPFLEED